MLKQTSLTTLLLLTLSLAAHAEPPVPCREGTLKNAAGSQAALEITLPKETLIPASAESVVFKFPPAKKGAKEVSRCFQSIKLMIKSPIPQPRTIAKRPLQGNESVKSLQIILLNGSFSICQYSGDPNFGCYDFVDKTINRIDIPVYQTGGGVSCTLGDLADILEANGFETNIGKSEACTKPIEGKKSKPRDEMKDLHHPAAPGTEDSKAQSAS